MEVRNNKCRLHAGGPSLRIPSFRIDRSSGGAWERPFLGIRRPLQETENSVAGWVARTRLLAEPLSPRGPQPVLRSLRAACGALNGPVEPLGGVPWSWY